MGVIEKLMTLAKLVAQSEHRYELKPTEGRNSTYYSQNLNDVLMAIETKDSSSNDWVNLVDSPSLVEYSISRDGGPVQSSCLLVTRTSKSQSFSRG